MTVARMSGQLIEALAQYRFAYLLTVGADSAAHVVTVTPRLVNAALVVPDLGRRTTANIAHRSAVTLIWPPSDPDGYSLIVDGEATLDDDRLDVTPTRAVLHRPAQAPSDRPAGRCEADCRELSITAETVI